MDTAPLASAGGDDERPAAVSSFARKWLLAGAAAGALLALAQLLAIGAGDGTSGVATLIGNVLSLGVTGGVIGWRADRAVRRDASQPSPGPSGDGALVGRHWRGELPLALSFFGIYVGGSVVLALGAVGLLLPDPAGLPGDVATGRLGLAAFAVAGAALLGWAIIGTWRSARRRIVLQARAGGRPVMAPLAQAALVWTAPWVPVLLLALGAR
jgi:hypothetical protein